MQNDYSYIIINVINTIFSNFFSSIDNTLYTLLDSTVFIDSSIIIEKQFQSIFFSNYGIFNIINSLITGVSIYYCFRLYFSNIFGTYIEKPYHFIIKIIIIFICTYFSTFICSQIININSLITDILRHLGKNITDKNISFNTLINYSNFLINSNEKYDIISFNGLLKSFLSFGLINLLFSYTIRYILIKILVFLFPFALLALTNSSTTWIFKSWLKSFLSLLFVQIFIVIILIFLFSINPKDYNLFSQISYISTIFILTKANSYIKEIIGGISTDFAFNSLNYKKIFK